MRRTNLYLDPEKLRALKMLAVSEDASVSDLVREAIDAIIEKRLTRNGSAESGEPVRLGTTTLLADALRQIDTERSADVPQDEIERDVADAIRESRAKRASGRRVVGLVSGKTSSDPERDAAMQEIGRYVAGAVVESASATGGVVETNATGAIFTNVGAGAVVKSKSATGRVVKSNVPAAKG